MDKKQDKLNDKEIKIIFDDGGSITFEPLAALEVVYAVCQEFDIDDTQFQILENKLQEENKNMILEVTTNDFRNKCGNCIYFKTENHIDR